jgi:hypothetical protein
MFVRTFKKQREFHRTSLPEAKSGEPNKKFLHGRKSAFQETSKYKFVLINSVTSQLLDLQNWGSKGCGILSRLSDLPDPRLEVKRSAERHSE